MNTDFKIIDLTHTLSPDIPTWDGSCGFDMSVSCDYGDCTAPDLFRVQKITCNAGIGTHMDAPAHVIPDAATIDQIQIENLVSDCVVIDVSGEADANYVAMPETIEKFENEHGTIAPNSFVIFYTGWDKHWSDKDAYINDHQFPSVHEETAKLLVERGISGLGIDTLSADTGKNGFPVHRAVLGAGKYLVENIANAKSLPLVGAKILVLPMKINGGTEAPVRLVALLNF